MSAKCHAFAVSPDDTDVCSARRQPEGSAVKDAGAVLSVMDALKREDYAIGVIAVALGVEAVRTAGKVDHLGKTRYCKLSCAHTTYGWRRLVSGIAKECKSPKGGALALQVLPAVPRLVQEGSATAKGLGSGLHRSRTQAAGRTQQWLSALAEDGRRQARVSQGALRVNSLSPYAIDISHPSYVHDQTV